MTRASHNLNERGQSLVEFAAIAPILFLLIFAILEFGRAFYEYSTVVNAASEGARYGIIDQDTDCITKVVTSTTNYSGLLNLSGSDVAVSCPTGCAFGRRLSVTVNYTFTAVTPFIPSFPLSGNSTMAIVSTSDKTCPY